MSYSLHRVTATPNHHNRVVQVALDAAEAGSQHALYIKLSNNMGAVLRKQELHEEVGTFKRT
jgi:hypothetical protein